MVGVVSSRIPVKKGYEEAFEQRWNTREWALTHEPIAER